VHRPRTFYTEAVVAVVAVHRRRWPGSLGPGRHRNDAPREGNAVGTGETSRARPH
jgi:hypothetical protein